MIDMHGDVIALGHPHKPVALNEPHKEIPAKTSEKATKKHREHEIESNKKTAHPKQVLYEEDNQLIP